MSPARQSRSGSLPRLGQISFVNTLPVVLPAINGAIAIPAQVKFGHPAELNAAYTNGELDLGAMSSFFYLEQNNFELLPGLSISSQGPTGSVLLFSKVELDKLNRTGLTASASSATSTNLLKVLFLEEGLGSVKIQKETNPDLDNPQTQAALVIGDYALLVDNQWSQKYLRIDLGEWWFQMCQLPMVFGVWAAKKSWVEEHRTDYLNITHALQQCKELGFSSLFKDVLEEASLRTGLSLKRLERYFLNELSCELDAEHQAGLEHFRQLCLKHGLLNLQNPAPTNSNLQPQLHPQSIPDYR